MEGTYRKSKGSAGLNGVQFQVSLVTVFLLNALRKLKGWKISTENEDAAKFDDIVMELSDGHSVLVQAKSKIKRKITKEQLLSTNPRNIDFSLPKYFFSYYEIKSKFKPKAVVVCTNTDVDNKGLENISARYSVPPHNPLHYEGSRCSTLTFNENILPDLKKQAQIYLEESLQGKGFHKAAITDENLRDFLKVFTVVFNYPNGEKLDNIIDLLLKRLTRYNVSSQELYKKIEDWFRQDRGEYLTKARANAIFWEIKSDQYCRVLKDYNVFFKRSNLYFKDTRRIFHVRAEDGYLLPTLQVYNTLHVENKTLFINPDCDSEEQKLAVEAFKLPRYEFFVLVLSKTVDRDKITDMKDILRQALLSHPYKKVVLVCKRPFVPNFDLGFEICDVDGFVSFEDIAEETRERLVRKKNILFQGKYITLEELLQASLSEDYVKGVRSDVLEILVKDEKVKVGTKLLDLNEDTSRYYINRTFERGISNKLDCDRSIMERKQIFTEKSILKVEDKVVLISDTAGMGKSTVLAKLAADVKETNTHIWVIRIELNDHTRVLRDFLRKKKESIQIVDLLNFHCDTKLQNSLEKFVFAMERRIVVFLDGFDEISPDYTKLVLNLLKNCQEATNIAKAIVTTRPHMSQALELILQVKPFVLQPFTRQNQVDFLTRYWMLNLQLVDASIEKCTIYSDTLIDKMSSWINKENNITAIPLQLRILAEIFQENISATDWEGCKEFLSGDEGIPTLPEKMNITKLYDMFVEKKLDIFIDKANPTGTATCNHFFNSHFHQYFVNHQSLAIDMILDDTTICELFTIYKYNESIETDMLKIGIVQKFSENLDFVHRTFAEYFVAKSILEISGLDNQAMNGDVKFQKFFIDEILCNPEFLVIRAFLESCLEDVVSYLPSDTFDNYKCHPCHDCKSRKHKSELVHLLAGEGCVATLQLMFKCINYKILIQEDTVEECAVDENALGILQRLVNAEGINIKDEKGNTPLHFAAESGHMKMLNFLVKMGARVDIKNKDGITALHAAAYNSHLDTVKFLVEQGADVNVRNKNGTTPLHSAAQDGHVDTVEFLIRCNAEIVGNNSGTFPLHLAAQDGHLDTVKVLLELCDVNIRNYQGITPLHLASANGHYNTVEYLTRRGAQVYLTDNDGFTALHVASQNGQLDIVTFLVDNGADINRQSKNGTSPLHSAAINGHLDVVEAFMEIGIHHEVDINVKNNHGTTPLHLAAKGGNIDMVKFLIGHDADASITNDDGFTALHLVAEDGHLDIVQFLVDHSTDINARNKSGNTALHLAIAKSHLDVVKHLVEHNIDVNATNNYGFTALHIATRMSCLKAIEFLLQHCSVDVKGVNEATPLHLAAQTGNLSVVKLLVEAGADVNATNCYGNTLMHEATHCKNFDMVAYLVEQGIEVSRKNNFGLTALHVAVAGGCSYFVNFFIKSGFALNLRDNEGNLPSIPDLDVGMCSTRDELEINMIDEQEPLHEAARKGDLDVVQFLVERGLYIDSEDDNRCTPLLTAAKWNRPCVIKYLVIFGANVVVKDQHGCTPLHYIARWGDLDCTMFLLERDADLNARNAFGQTPLHCAAGWGNLECVKFFIEQGVRMDIRDAEGRTPLHLAARWGELNCIRYFAELGVDVNFKDYRGRTPLHSLARWGDLQSVMYIVGKGADIYARDDKGQTPLHSSARWGDIEVIKYFIERGVEADVKDKQGNTPLHIAANWGDIERVKFFVEKGTSYMNILNNEGMTPLHAAASWGDLACVKYFIECGADIEVRDGRGRTPLHLATLSGNSECVELFVELQT